MNAPQSWIGTSWKMNKTLPEALDFAQTLAGFAARCDPCIQPFVIPPFTAIREVARALADTRVLVGAQNTHWEDAGAWTGEVSPVMLKDCGARLVEIGHSERRTHFGETDRTVGLKVAAVVGHGMVPLVCVGETLDERNAGRAQDVLARQVEGALAFLGAGRPGVPVLFAYEPVWAIGAGGGAPATADYADAQQAHIKAVAAGLLPAAPPVLYGGSVNPDNCVDLARQPNVDGLFIGRSAWQAAGYIDILQRCGEAL